MGRQPRQASETGYYHVIVRGNRRAQVFQTAEDYTAFCHFTEETMDDLAIEVAHFCLMPNHVHLLLRSVELAALSQAMHRLQRRYWFHARRTARISGHLWQGRFHSFPIDSEAYLLEAARYIERNPLEARLVNNLRSYPWSSYEFYVTGQHSLVPLDPTPVYHALGLTSELRRAAYQQFVDTSQPYDKSMRHKLRLLTAYA